jgi:enolase
MIRIKGVDAWEILDSRGRPTVAVALVLEDGINESFDGQEQLDRRLLELDGTMDKSHLGANALLAVSLAFARAAAARGGMELFEYFASLLPNASPCLPALTINLFSGGKHAFGQVAIQDVLVVPKLGLSVTERLAQTYDIYQEAAAIAMKRYRAPALTADEGGLAPPFKNSSEMLETAAEAIQAAGYELGKEVALAVDAALVISSPPTGFTISTGKRCLRHS